MSLSRVEYTRRKFVLEGSKAFAVATFLPALLYCEPTAPPATPTPEPDGLIKTDTALSLNLFHREMVFVGNEHHLDSPNIDGYVSFGSSWGKNVYRLEYENGIPIYYGPYRYVQFAYNRPGMFGYEPRTQHHAFIPQQPPETILLKPNFEYNRKTPSTISGILTVYELTAVSPEIFVKINMFGLESEGPIAWSKLMSKETFNDVRLEGAWEIMGESPEYLLEKYAGDPRFRFGFGSALGAGAFLYASSNTPVRQLPKRP